MSTNTTYFSQNKQENIQSLSKLIQETNTRQRKIQEWKPRINHYYVSIKKNIHKTNSELLFSIRLLFGNIQTLKENLQKLEQENLLYLKKLSEKSKTDSRLENIHQQIKKTLNNFNREAKNVQYNFEKWEKTIS